MSDANLVRIELPAPAAAVAAMLGALGEEYPGSVLVTDGELWRYGFATVQLGPWTPRDQDDDLGDE